MRRGDQVMLAGVTLRIEKGGQLIDTVVTDTAGLYRTKDGLTGRYDIIPSLEGYRFDPSVSNDLGGLIW